MKTNFDPSELRDRMGRWTRVGSASLTDASRTPVTDVMVIASRIDGIAKGKKISINGCTIDNIPSKGLRVRIGSESRYYPTPTDAANAVADRQHRESGMPLSKTIQIKQERDFRKISGAPPPSGGISVSSIVFDTHGKTTRGQNDMIRNAIARTAQLQGRFVPGVVSGASVWVGSVMSMRDAGGHRKGSSSSLGYFQTLSRGTTSFRGTMTLRYDVFTSAKSPGVLKYCLDSGWWVPVDKTYTLDEVIMSHEYGHGVHGFLNIPTSLNYRSGTPGEQAEAQRFYAGLSRALGTSPPEKGKSGVLRILDIDSWWAKNQSLIAQKVSRYGGSRPNEMFAELWLEYTLSSNPRPPAKFYGDYVMKKQRQLKGVA